MEMRLEMITCSAVPVQAAPGITKLILTCPSSVSRLICGFLFLLLLLLPLPLHSPYLYTFSIIGKVSGKQDSWLEWSHPFKICLFASFTWHWETSLILTFACCQRNWKPYTSYKPCHVPYIKSMPVKYYWGFRGCVLTPAHQHQAWFSANQRFISPSQWIFFPLNGYKMQTHKKSRLTHKKF